MSLVIEQRINNIDHLIERLTALRDGKYLVGDLNIKKRGYGKVVGAWGNDWTKKITFRLHRGAIQYMTVERGAPGCVYGGNRTRWMQAKFGSALDLLAGDDNSIGYTTKCRVSNLVAQEPPTTAAKEGGE